MQLHDKYNGQVVGLSVNLDNTKKDGNVSETIQKTVRAKLNDLAIDAENYISRDAYTPVTDKFDVFLPALLIYDTNGKLHKKCQGEHIYKQADEVIQTLLKKSETP